jgi:predicted nucleic acid-binding protein
MDGYLLDTNAASILWDARHADHGKIRSFLASISPAPVWISIIALAEIEYGLKTAPRDECSTPEECERRDGKISGSA